MSALLLLLGGQGFTVFETSPLTSRGTDTYYTTSYETTYNTNKATDTTYLTNVLTNTNKNTVTLFQTQTIYGTNYPTSRGTNYITNRSTSTQYTTYWWVSTYYATQYSRNTVFNAATSQPAVGYSAVWSGYSYDSRHAYIYACYIVYLGREPNPGDVDIWVSLVVDPQYPNFVAAYGDEGWARLGEVIEKDSFIYGENRSTVYNINTVYDQDTWFPTQYYQLTSRNTTTIYQTDWTTSFETFYSNITSHLTGTSRNTDTIYDTLTTYNTNKSTTTIYDTTIETYHITNQETTTIFTTTFTTQRFTGVDQPTFNTQP